MGVGIWDVGRYFPTRVHLNVQGVETPLTPFHFPPTLLNIAVRCNVQLIPVTLMIVSWGLGIVCWGLGIASWGLGTVRFLMNVSGCIRPDWQWNDFNFRGFWSWFSDGFSAIFPEIFATVNFNAQRREVFHQMLRCRKDFHQMLRFRTIQFRIWNPRVSGNPSISIRF